MAMKSKRKRFWLWRHYDVFRYNTSILCGLVAAAILLVLYSLIILMLHQAGITKPGLLEDTALPALCSGIILAFFAALCR